jgi:hypothetical protein
MGYRGAHFKLFHNTNFLLFVKVAALRVEEAVVRGALDVAAQVDIESKA